MKILIVGNSAREHAIAKKIAEDSRIYPVISKKNPGIIRLSEEYLIADTKDGRKIAKWAKEKGVDLAFVSPDPSLAAGVSDAIQEEGIPISSPLKEAARIEWDKAFARNLMEEFSVPNNLKFRVAIEENEVKEALSEFGEVAVKPIGLTGGKGVKIMGEHLRDEEDALKYAKELIKKDGAVVIEEKLVGEEFSFQAFVDGKNLVFMPPVQDHKRAYEDDKGPNTGSMGSYSTGDLLPFLSEKDIEEAKKTMVATVNALREKGIGYKGILYGQFMAVKDGVRLIEFNSRFGDPEAINVLALLKNSLSDILIRIKEGRLKNAEFENKFTVVKYLVPEGYPTNPVGDAPVYVDEEKIKENGAQLYFASVYEKDGQMYTTSSRSFALLGKGESLEEAEKKVEVSTRYIKGKVWHRKDIGTKELVEKHKNNLLMLRK